MPAEASTPALNSGAPGDSASPSRPPPHPRRRRLLDRERGRHALGARGYFRMGANRGGQEDEQPEHEVTLRAFWLDRTEVTNAAYEACVAAHACRPHDATSAQKNRFGGDAPFRGPISPISSISWEDALAFCAFSGKRLPTEAEWEEAGRRARMAAEFPWGGTNRPTPNARVCHRRNAHAAGGVAPERRRTRTVISTWPATSGNGCKTFQSLRLPAAGKRRRRGRTCSEALAARASSVGQDAKASRDPTHPHRVRTRAARGAFNSDGPGLRSSNRVHHPPQFRLIMSGVRCAKDGTL